MGKFLTSLCFFFSFASASFAADLRILTYDGIASDWGIGPKWEQEFEKQCQCDIEFVAVNGGSAAIITRAMIDSSAYDILLGIDDTMIEDAIAKNLLIPHELSLPKLAVDWQSPYAIPFDYGWLAFVAKKGKILPDNMEALIKDKNISIVMEDPQTSGFAHWLYALYGDETPQKWQEMKSHIVTLTTSWSEAYNLFLEGEADMVLSYTSSPAYHKAFEKDDSYIAPAFNEGNLRQIELAAMAKTTQNPEFARDFLRFLLTPKAQGEIALTNIMFPVIDIELLPAFQALDIPQKSIISPLSNQEIYRIWAEQVEK